MKKTALDNTVTNIISGQMWFNYYTATLNNDSLPKREKDSTTYSE